ncbi:MAG: regulatory protein RecX [Gemmatimonadetes bacterium]|nr:regulatory protein RecX [Gemmatimonadota bacterium]MYD24550.1 regulatory protein RecX [Gemmatimonadota bacterium]
MTMPTITDITPRGSGGRRERKVTIDGERILTITEETFLRFGLFDGQAMDPERLQEVELADGVSRAMTEAHRLIDHRMRTRRELAVKLKSRGRTDEVIDQVLDRLEHAGLIDDGRFARLWIDERLRRRPAGLSLLRRELRQKGIDAEVVDTALEESASREGETERAYEALRRQSYRYARLDRDAAHRRMVAFLGRRGFGQAVIYQVVHRVLDEIEESRN